MRVNGEGILVVAACLDAPGAGRLIRLREIRFLLVFSYVLLLLTIPPANAALASNARLFSPNLGVCWRVRVPRRNSDNVMTAIDIKYDSISYNTKQQLRCRLHGIDLAVSVSINGVAGTDAIGLAH